MKLFLKVLEKAETKFVFTPSHVTPAAKIGRTSFSLVFNTKTYNPKGPVIGTGISVPEHTSTGLDFLISVSNWSQHRHFSISVPD